MTPFEEACHQAASVDYDGIRCQGVMLGGPCEGWFLYDTDPVSAWHETYDDFGPGWYRPTGETTHAKLPIYRWAPDSELTKEDT